MLESNGTRRAPRQRLSAQQVALEELRDSIQMGELAPGEQIMQEAVAASYGVSRAPLREALKILEGEGIVQYSAHRGYQVAVLSAEEIQETYRVRDLLEDEAIRRAIPLLDETDFARLTEANARLNAAYGAGDLRGILTENREFHFTLFARGSTGRLLNLIRICWDSVQSYRSGYFKVPSYHDLQIAEHQGIIEAARAGDVDRVLELSRLHRQHAVEAITGGDAAH